MNTKPRHIFFYTLFAFDAIVVAVLVFFFLSGLQYASDGVAQGLWLLVIGTPVSLMTGAWQLKAKGWTKSANGLLALVAVPPLLFVTFYGVLLIAQPSWH